MALKRDERANATYVGNDGHPLQVVGPKWSVIIAETPGGGLHIKALHIDSRNAGAEFNLPNPKV